MDASWEVFVSYLLYNRPQLIKVDTTFAAVAPMKSYPFSVVCVIVDLPVTKERLPSDAALAQVARFETRAEAIANGSGVYVGRFSYDDLTALNFYANDGKELIKKLDASVELRGIARHHCRAQEDRDWKHYTLSLYYHEPRARTQLLNSKARSVLSAVGDDGSTVRNVFHIAHFWNKGDLSSYRTFLEKEGYKIKFSATKPGGGGVWLLTFKKHQAPASLDAETWQLMQKAYELNGGYDGWRPQVSKTP
jgi:hypothetical protein